MVIMRKFPDIKNKIICDFNKTLFLVTLCSDEEISPCWERCYLCILSIHAWICSIACRCHLISVHGFIVAVAFLDRSLYMKSDECYQICAMIHRLSAVYWTPDPPFVHRVSQCPGKGFIIHTAPPISIPVTHHLFYPNKCTNQN